jgi:hypothetical protein
MGEGTFAGTGGNDKVAPFPDLPALALDREVRPEARSCLSTASGADAANRT